MAEAVPRGQLDLRTAASTPTYGDELGAAFGSFWSDYQAMTPEAQARAAVQAREYLDNLIGERRAE
ncbi:MAG: hypothetical protein HKP61_12325 [Dactylosporangium sp.]|nr:hypothetical protein [Dactylosporangium sp.]